MRRAPRAWALLPAGARAALDGLSGFGLTTELIFVSAMALILTGGYLIYRQGWGGLTRHG